MAILTDARRVFSLTIIEAKDIRSAPRRPSLYVAVYLSGGELSKTKITRCTSPTWGHTCSITVELNSVLCLHLKRSRALFSAAVLGCVDIVALDLLDRCNGQPTTLALVDKQGRDAGSLVVQLREEEACHVVESTLRADQDVTDGEIAALPRVSEPAENAVWPVAMVQDVVELLRQVVEKTKTLADVVDEAARLHLYAIIAWRIMSLAYTAVRRQIHSAGALLRLIRSLDDLYAFVDVVRESRDIQPLEAVIIRMTIQTTECGIFITQLTSNAAHQSILDTNTMVSNLSEALGLLKEELGPGGISQTVFVPAQTSITVRGRVQIDELKALLGPANMDVEYRPTCLPGTRVEILQDLLVSLTDPNRSHNIIWLRGLAGSGKSTILNTIAQYVSELCRCGAFLFWDRNDPVNGDPRRVIRTLAYQLASFNSDYAEKLASQIKSRPQIISSSFNAQFQHLLLEPLSALATSGPVFIILDALDECGDRETRKELLHELSTSLSKLPSMFRVLIASREEPDICFALSRSGISIKKIEIDNDSTRSDIMQFFRCRLSRDNPAFAGYGLPSNWPGGQTIQQLVDRAGGLFIWASTTVRFIEGGFPTERLTRVMDASAHGESHHELEELYWVALTHPFRSSDQTEANMVCAILGAIVVACEQLTDEQLSELLDLELGTVQGILSQLQPLLQYHRGMPVQVLHASFTDFLCDPNRCRDPRWCIIASNHHQNIVEGCFRVMRRVLRFNICGIESSYYRHQEIEGIQERIDAVITPALMYANQYWADHLKFVSLSTNSTSHIVDAILHFIKHQLLYWIEVFSLKNQMSTVSVVLKKAAACTRDCQPNLSAAISEASKFVNAFGYPIGHSVPHIYISALPFLPSESPILHNLRAAFQNIPRVKVGISERWPAISQTLQGHGFYVGSVAFSPDGTRIASGSDDHTVRIWDAVSGSLICGPLRGHTDAVKSVAFSPDSTRVVSGSADKTIYIWDAVTGAPIGGPMQEHTDVVRSVVFSPDGTRIASGADDETVRIWNATSNLRIGQPLQGHSGIVWSVVFSPDGTRIISGAGDETVRIWDAMSGEPIGEPLRGHAGPVSSVAFSPRGTRIASGSHNATVRIWDAESRTPIGEPLQGHDGRVLSVAFSPNGTRILSGSIDHSVQIWDVESRSLMSESSPGHACPVRPVAFSSDFTRTASSSYDGLVEIWDTMSDATIGEPLQGHVAAVYSVAFSRDGTRLVSCSYDETVQIWDVMSGTSIGEPLRGHTGPVCSVKFSPDGSRIVSGSDDKTLRMWDAMSGATIGEPLRGHTGSIWSVAFSPDSTRIVSGSSDGTIRIWDAISGAPIGEPLLGHANLIWSVAFSPDGSRIASGSSDETVRIWDAESGATIGEPLRGHTSTVWSVTFSPDGTRIASGSDDQTVRIWDVALCTTIGEPLRGYPGLIYSVAFSPDGSQIISGSSTKTVQIWDVKSCAPIGKPLQGHVGKVFSVAISPDGTHIASGSTDNTVRIWDTVSSTATDELLQRRVGFSATEPEPVVGTPAFSSDSHLQDDGWVTTEDGLLLFWVPPDHRSGLFWPRTCAIMGAQPTQLNMGHFVHGPQWALCRTQNE